MNREAGIGAVGAVLMLVGVVLAATGPGRTELSTGAEIALAGVVVGGLVAALVKLHGSPGTGGDDSAPAAWSAESGFASPRPEDAATDHDLSGAALAATVDRAATHARERGVEEGVDVVRPALRATLAGAMAAGGRDPQAVEAAIDAGRWTDDDLAASVLSSAVDPPPQSLRERTWAWLYPERAVRRRVRRATDAVAAAAEAALPAVPGQDAARTMPVVRPTLSQLQRGVDGRLQPAADPTAVARGPLPPEPSLAADDQLEGESS